MSESEKKMESLKSAFEEYNKLKTRIYRHGNPDIVKKAGRPRVSEEQKQATYIASLERRKQKRRDKAVAEGRNPKTGKITKNKTVNI
jgi:hypothetical protein